MPKQRADWNEIARLLRAGSTIQAAADGAGAHWNTARLVADRLEAGLPIDVPARTLERLERNRAIRRMAKTTSNVAVAAHFGVSESMIRKVIARAADDQITMCEPVVIAKRPAAAPKRVATPVAPKPAKASATTVATQPAEKLEPLFFRCSSKHPITRSNRVKGTENDCLVCKKRRVPLPPALSAARDVLIAELEAVIAREVAELTADLRPEMEKAA